VELLLEAMEAALTRVQEKVSAADVAHAAELADDAAPREVRDEQIAALREALIGIRASLTSAYGAALPAAYGVPSNTCFP
jgi:hypothetical protein